MVLLVIGLAGCGIPSDATAHSFPLVTQPGANLPSGTKILPVYFVEAGRLVSVPRKVFQITPTTALEVLAAGPTTNEELSGVQTDIEPPASVSLVGTPVQNLATVRIDSNFLDLPADLLPYAYAQIVYTLTAVPALAINSVQFVVGDNDFPWSLVVLPNGSAAPSGTVSRGDYCALAKAGCPHHA